MFFSVSNGIKQGGGGGGGGGGILSPKLFNIYVDVLSQKKNEKTVGCSFNGTIINRFGLQIAFVCLYTTHLISIIVRIYLKTLNL